MCIRDRKYADYVDTHDNLILQSVRTEQERLQNDMNLAYQVQMCIRDSCNAVASTFGILGSVARKYAHKIPFVVKLNHNELLTYPNTYDQVLFGTVKEARCV